MKETHNGEHSLVAAGIAGFGAGMCRHRTVGLPKGTARQPKGSTQNQISYPFLSVYQSPRRHELGVRGGGAEGFGGGGGGVGVVPPGLEKELELAVNDGLGDGGFQADLRQPG